MRFYAFVLGAVAALSFSLASAAPPVRCASGYQDSSCAKLLSNPPQTPPECPSGAGWQTLADAVWIGSKYRDPVCKYSPPPSGCPSGYSEASPATWNGTAWVGQQCVLIPPPSPTCPSGQTMTVPPTWDGSAWVGMQCVAPQAPQPPAPTCPSGQTQTAAPSWDGSAWVGLQCVTPSTPVPAAPTCPSGQTQTASPSWDGSAWVGLQCVVTPPAAPTCPSGQTQTAAPAWNGSAWVGLQCAVVPPAPPTCPTGQTQTVAPTWNGSAWVGLGCVPTQTPQPIVSPISYFWNRFQMVGPSVEYATLTAIYQNDQKASISSSPVCVDIGDEAGGMACDFMGSNDFFEPSLSSGVDRVTGFICPAGYSISYGSAAKINFGVIFNGNVMVCKS